MRFADQMCVEVIHVSASFATTVALPRTRLTVESSVEEIQCLVGKDDVAMETFPQI